MTNLVIGPTEVIISTLKEKKTTQEEEQRGQEGIFTCLLVLLMDMKAILNQPQKSSDSLGPRI